MYGSNYVFSKGFFIAWIVVAIIWMWITMLIAGFYPIIDGLGQIRSFFSKDNVSIAQTEVLVERDEKVVEPRSTELSSAES